MLNWLKQTSTIGGLLGLVLTGLQLYQTGGDVVTISLGVLSAALLLVKDGKFLAGLSVFFVLSVGTAGCGAAQIQNLAAKSATDVACGAACNAQNEFDAEVCGSVCEEIADTSRKVLKDPSLEGIFDVACDVACGKQTRVDVEVCSSVCNFLANTGKDVLTNLK